MSVTTRIFVTTPERWMTLVFRIDLQVTRESPSGDPGRLLARTRRPVSCLGSGGIQYLSIFPQQFAPYFLISSSNSGNNLCTQVNRSCSFSMGFPWAGHRSSNPAIPGSS
ncbi:hypothetical protein F2Q68_00044288 [Brassica cretica]|uniref:Uncharacterized protein n=1 Tax=Brassica cretica TaxID=69181 RepID=A0A8S9LKB4_BRACR|nr:hypothetical protein F2Q68_00044288 [Brassica cretica]